MRGYQRIKRKMICHLLNLFVKIYIKKGLLMKELIDKAVFFKAFTNPDLSIRQYLTTSLIG